MSRTKSFFQGASFAYLYQGCALVIGLWLTPFYIRTLGTKDFGIWLVGLQVLNFLLLCDFGIISVISRDVAHASGREQAEPGTGQLATLIAQTVKVVLAQTGLIAVLAVILFFIRPSSDPGLRGAIGLVLAVFVISYPFRLFPAILQGLQDLKFLGQLRLWLWAFSSVLVVVLLLLGARFYALACGWCVQQMGHDVVTFLRLRRIRPDVLSADIWNKSGPFRWRWFTRGFWVSVSALAYSLIAGTDLLIVGRFIGPTVVVVYSSTAKLITVLQNQPQTLASVALPGLSHLRTSESRERILQATTSLTQAMLLFVGLVFCIILAVNQQFVSAWLGVSFFGGMKLTVLLLLNFLVRQIDYTLAITLFAFGREKIGAIRSLADGAVSSVLACILVGHFGLEGVAFAFLCGGVFIAIPVDAYLLTKELDVSFRELIRPYVPYVWRFAVIGCVGLAIKARFGAPNLLNVAVSTTVVALIYLALVIPYVWRTPLRGYIESITATITGAMRSRILGWSNNG